ncbi:MAG: hypothetical protein IMY75_07805, partial [Chloroflexi bacterium]|nr:hypothetical protein [Chloroflexota bacterium]
TPRPTPTPEPEPEVEETPTATPGPGNEEEEIPPAVESVGFLDLTLALLGVLIVGGTGYYVVRFDNGPASRALRVALWCMIGGLALYLAYALRVPGAVWLREQAGVWAAGWMGLLGGVVPLVIARIAGRWRRLG